MTSIQGGHLVGLGRQGTTDTRRNGPGISAYESMVCTILVNHCILTARKFGKWVI